MLKRLTSLGLLCMLAIASYAQRLNEILSELSAPANQSVLVVSHRGDWRNAPENSLQAFQNCIDMGVDMVELDLKKTKDGELILMHDNTLNRTTNGTGKPEDFTLAELKELRLKNGAGCLTRHKIPTLRETMLLCKGKILVNVDKGYEYFEDVQKILEETGTANQCVVKEKIPYQTIKEQHGYILDKVIFMPKADLCKPEAESIIDSYLQNEKPIEFYL
jgi:glycerophosphoryl diester phosphodiesterase